MRTVMFISLALLVGVPPLLAQEGELIASMDEMRFSPPKEKGSASLVDGKVGKAVRFHFDPGCHGHVLHQQHPRQARVGPGRWLLVLGPGRR